MRLFRRRPSSLLTPQISSREAYTASYIRQRTIWRGTLIILSPTSTLPTILKMLWLTIRIRLRPVNTAATEMALITLTPTAWVHSIGMYLQRVWPLLWYLSTWWVYIIIKKKTKIVPKFIWWFVDRYFHWPDWWPTSYQKCLGQLQPKWSVKSWLLKKQNTKRAWKAETKMMNSSRSLGKLAALTDRMGLVAIVMRDVSVD